MDRRSFIKSTALTQALASLPLRSSAVTTAKDSPIAVGPGTLTMRYELSLRRLLSGGPPVYSSDFLLADVRPDPVRRFTNFSGDLSGRYVGALAVAARNYGKGFPQLDELVPRIIALQKPDGHFGTGFHFGNPNDEDLAVLWGNGRLLIGLLEYYRHKPLPEVLQSAERIGDFLVKVGPLMNSDSVRQQFGAGHYATSYICWTQNIEGLAELFRLTKDSSYIDLAEKISSQVARRPSEHVHGFLTSLRGIVELYRVTGDRQYLDQVEREWHAVADSKDLLVTGGVPERWSPLVKPRTEGCAEADWVRLNLALWTLTGKPEYLAMAEKAIFNELAMNQFHSGDFGHRVPTNSGIAGDPAVRAWWCCTLHGLRCFPEVSSAAFRTKHGVIYYDLPVDSRIERDGLILSAVSSLEQDGSVNIAVLSTNGSESRLAIRQPDWTTGLEVFTNGQRSGTEDQEGYRRVTCNYKTGDAISIQYAMKTTAMRWRGTKRIALFHGPWLLGVNKAADSFYFDEPRELNRLRVGKVAQGVLRLEPARNPNNGAFAVPVAQFRVKYLPGGYPCQPLEATLCAAAEQTRMASTDWEFLFNPEDAA